MSKNFIAFMPVLCLAVGVSSGAAAQVRAEHCGRVLSDDGNLAANFTLRLKPEPSGRQATVFLCDNLSNCDTIFMAPGDARVSVAWLDNANLAIVADRGTLVPPGTLEPTGSGRPPVRITMRRDGFRSVIPGAQTFSRSACRVDPPMITVDAPSGTRR